jgi:hypothetical protein
MLLLLGLCFSAFAASEQQLQERYDDANRHVNRSRGLTLAILKQIKQLDKDCRASSGVPLPARKSEAQNRLGRLEPLVDAFNVNTDETTEALSKLHTDLNSESSAKDLAGRLGPEIDKLKTDLKKYRGLVQRYWDKATGDFGQPIEQTERMEPVYGSATGQPVTIHGEFTAALGSSKYKKPHADPTISASSGDFSFNLSGRYTPSSRTTVLGRLGHKTTVERREISLTDFGAAVTHQLSPVASVKAGLDLSKYSDKENDVADYSQTGIFARLNARTANHRGNIEIRRDSRGYSNINGADYNTFSFTARDLMSFGTGNVNMQLRYLKKTNDIEVLDHTELNPSFVYHFSQGGTQVGASYQQFKMPNLDDSPLENNRLKFHLYAGRRSSSGTVKWGPEVQMYKYPNLDDADMTDLKFIYQSSMRGRQTKMMSWNLVYRLHKHDLMFDFAQVQFRRNSRPVGSGRYSKFNLAARYYIENSHDTATVDDPLLSPYYSTEVLSPPHTLDVFYSMGWQMLFTTWLQRLSIGPILSHRAFIDQNGDDRSNKELDIDYILQNPINFGGIGFEVRAAGVAGYAVSWSFRIKLLHETYYNAEPMRKRTKLEWRAASNYRIDDRWSAEGFADMHQTRYDLDSPENLDKLKIGVQVRYLFDVRQ